MRVEYPDPKRLKADLQQQLSKRRQSNVFRALMISPNIASGFLAYSDAIRYENTLSLDLLELAVLRVGYTSDSVYETTHHEEHALKAGLSKSAIQAARTGDLTGDLSDVERLVIQLVDEILANDGLSEAGLRRALEVFSVNQAADLVLSTGFYKGVCYFLRSFDVDLENERKAS